MAPPPLPSTLVLDDGELGDVRRALEEIGVEYTYLRGGAVEGLTVAQPRRLLVATARQALRLGDRPSGMRSREEGGPVRVAVVSEDSNALRAQLRRAGFDYLVRQPLHPSALKLLLLRALYRGPERRVAVRYPVGEPVQYRTGLRRRPATLVEIALRGCRIQTPRPAEVDSRITVILPKEFTEGSRLSLSGWVMRCEPAGGEGAEHEVAVAFDSLSASAESALRELLRSKIPAAAEPLEPTQPLEPIAAADPPPPAAPAEDGDRRESPRGTYQRQVLAIKDQAQRVLMGRDLSTGGMLVEQSLALREGDRVSLAIFGRPREEPIVVRARVVREGEEGVALQFFAVGKAEAERLEALVAALPSVERLADGETESMGTVMAEIVQDADEPPDEPGAGTPA